MEHILKLLGVTHECDRHMDGQTFSQQMPRLTYKAETKTTPPSNLRPTTRECVHLLTRGYFRSCEEDGGHTIHSTITENPKPLANLAALCFIESETSRSEFYIARLKIFNVFAPVTLNLTRWPSYTNSRIPWRYTGCANTNFLR